ncbi:hypothetical protein [Actinoplanes sp. NPDC049265]|uniref:hypothetical protein n=1 Tax=Actinoplanes sp. NPDC049265 TaxID=3363902 RepID=UPI00371ED46C
MAKKAANAPTKATAAPAKVAKATKEARPPAHPTGIPAQPQVTEPTVAKASPPTEPEKKAEPVTTAPPETTAEPETTAGPETTADVTNEVGAVAATVQGGDVSAALAVPAEKTATRRTEPWAQLVANPGHAPELLALAAVQSIGPRAADWARRMRERYPHATDASLARLAERQFIRFGGVGSVFAAAAGSYAPIALLSSNALTYAELVLHVAAAHQVDPTDRRRAVDLLVLTQVHATPEDAEAALTTAEQPAYEEETHLTDAVWRLARMASAQGVAWAIVKQVNRVFPGVTLLSAIITSRSGVRTVGMRATRFYSRLSQDADSRA